MVSVNLSDSELVLLDGKCSGNVQSVVDEAKARLAQISKMPDTNPNIAAFIADVISEINKNGILRFSRRDVRNCKICGKSAGYQIRQRATKYHNKGTINYDKPLYLQGVELADRAITFKGSVYLGCCFDCWQEIQPILAESIKDLKAQIPESITGEPSKWVKAKRKKCENCGWEGNEMELRKLPALMGGHYPGGCPECKAENRLFGKDFIKPAEGFDILPKESEAQQGQEGVK